MCIFHLFLILSIKNRGEGGGGGWEWFCLMDKICEAWPKLFVDSPLPDTQETYLKENKYLVSRDRNTLYTGTYELSVQRIRPKKLSTEKKIKDTKFFWYILAFYTLKKFKQKERRLKDCFSSTLSPWAYYREGLKVG